MSASPKRHPKLSKEEKDRLLPARALEVTSRGGQEESAVHYKEWQHVSLR